MKKITIGTKKYEEIYDFRETCFGICVNKNKILLTKKDNEISLVGGGIEEGETYTDCLKREFLEEIGCFITRVENLYTIDCFWITKNNSHMESLANIFLVEIDNKRIMPSEKGCELYEIHLTDALDVLELPYQKRAIVEYIANHNNLKHKL